jgi:riboflavin kinase/FMN adenylyltransferase
VLVEEELAEFSPPGETLLTIGVFDGVHRGHQHLIARLRERARREELLPGVVTFRQHPEDLLSPGRTLPFLTDVETRTRLLRNEGVDIIVPLSFTKELAGLEPRRFVELLREHLKMRGLVVGPDFALGKGRRGDIATLRRLGKEMGFSVTAVPPLKLNGEVVSSTSIRQALADGDMRKYRELSGHPFSLKGRVVTGAGRGAGLGFPTANLEVSAGQALPADGVYASLAHINGQVFHSMTNIGVSPTFGNTERTVESYLVDYRGDLYGTDLMVDIVARLRDEKKFASADELKKQLAEDVRKGEKMLKSLNGDQHD